MTIRFRHSYFVFMLSVLGTWNTHSVVIAQSVAVVPVFSTGTFTINGSQIIVAPGAVVTLEILVSDWSDAPGNPQLFAGQATLDPQSFQGAHATPANFGADLLPLGYALPDPDGGDRPLGLFVETNLCSISGRNCSPGQAACAAVEGLCAPNPRWFVVSCCALGGIISTAALDVYSVAGVCLCGALPDPHDQQLGYMGTLKLVVPANADGSYTIALKPEPVSEPPVLPLEPLTGDGTFLIDQSSSLIPDVALKSALITVIPTAMPPQPAPPPNHFPKNRYVSFAPGAVTNELAYQVRLSGSELNPGAVGFTAWASAPTLVAPTQTQVVSQPVFRLWNEPVIHLGDCEIMPRAAYEIRSTTDGTTFSSALVVNTASRPVDGKNWGDLVGVSNGATFTPPNGLVNVVDVIAVGNFIRQITPLPEFPQVNLQSSSTGDSCLNHIVNTADQLMVVLALGGHPYPFVTDPTSCGVCPP